ncbi:hypothetical protein scyTo_0013428 [Scyliorhinus torazame]|uniref:CID domain-containing protein n=1 Tax=Scyliorhinus torazame TaxID=75743 RepID=A0A401NWG1_SCYTO|nr:hypothetical protein [Scyliorhinus torazame]
MLSMESRRVNCIQHVVVGEQTCQLYPAMLSMGRRRVNCIQHVVDGEQTCTITYQIAIELLTFLFQFLSTAKPSRKLTFLYLANDVIQNSKKKGPEFTKDFAPVLVDAFSHVSSESDENCKKHLERVLTIWQERMVYENNFIDQLKQIVSTEKKTKKRTFEQIQEEDDDDYLSNSTPKEPPETEDLIKSLQELENAASGDAAVRQKIASLPPEVQDVSLLDKIADKESADRLSKTVDEACMLLADYNGRLAAELEDRKQLARMLADYIRSQNEILAEKERKLEEYKHKLAKVTQVRKELKSHIQSLPDLSQLPNVTGGLAPLPSAGDLFSTD